MGDWMSCMVQWVTSVVILVMLWMYSTTGHEHHHSTHDGEKPSGFHDPKVTQDKEYVSFLTRTRITEYSTPTFPTYQPWNHHSIMFALYSYTQNPASFKLPLNILKSFSTWAVLKNSVLKSFLKGSHQVNDEIKYGRFCVYVHATRSFVILLLFMVFQSC